MPKTQGPRTVVYVHDNVEFGGIETLQVNILRHLDRSRYDPVVLVAGYGDGDRERAAEFRARLTDLDVPLVIPADVGGHRAVRAARRVVQVAGSLRETGADVVHIQTRHPEASRRMTLAAWCSPARATVRTEHVQPGPHIGWTTRYTVRPFDWVTAAIITDSDADRREQIALVGRKPEKVIRSYCGIDASLLDPEHDVVAAKRRIGLSPDETVVGTVGRLHRQKGHVHLVRAAASVVAEHPTVRFLLVGDGPLEGELRTLARDLGLGDRIVFAGFQPDPLPFMQAMDIAVMPSLWEGFSISMQEFMALAKPMVTSDHHSFREAIAHETHGLITPMGDPIALANAIECFLVDPALGRRLGLAAAARVRNEFSIQRHTQELMHVYDRVLEGAQSCRPKALGRALGGVAARRHRTTTPPSDGSVAGAVGA